MEIPFETTCSSLSLIHEPIDDDDNNNNNNNNKGDVKNVVLAVTQRKREILREVHCDADPPVTDEQTELVHQDEGQSYPDRKSRVNQDSITNMVPILPECGRSAEYIEAGETKCQDDSDIRTVSSDDLECMYGTLPFYYLPATPRTSNVTPEGKLQGSKRSFVSSFCKPETYSVRQLLGPEMNEEDGGEDHDLHWV